MKAILKNCIIAATGDFGDARKHENLKRWVEANGGHWSSRITKDTTHLITSKDHWKQQVKLVRDARKEKTVKIVTYDWLEDSLQKKSKKRESTYLWTTVEKRNAKLKEHRRTKEARILKKDAHAFGLGCKGAMTDLMSDLHHLYVDATGFTYSIILLRIDIRTNSSERVQLKIYETHTKPHTYITYLRHSGSQIVITETEVASRGSSYAVAFAAFRQSFAARCGYVWEDRLDKHKVARAIAHATDEMEKVYRMARAEERTLTREEQTHAERKGKVFMYTLPAKGEPRGEIPVRP